MTLARHVSSAPPARIARLKAVEDDQNAVRNARAARTVAGHADGVEDCIELLAMLGLDDMGGKPRRTALAPTGALGAGLPGAVGAMRVS